MSGGRMSGGRMSGGRLSGGLMSGGLMSAHQVRQVRGKFDVTQLDLEFIPLFYTLFSYAGFNIMLIGQYAIYIT